jgi:hypothetical protein
VVEPEPGQEHDEDAEAFGERLEEALVGRVIAAAKVDWKAAAWLLTRRWPNRWGAR